jgi:cytochrome c-type biogenesis protein CcmE
MKKTYLFGIIVIAIAVMIIIITAGDASTYVTFHQAREMAEKGITKKIHVVGELKKDEEGEVQGVEAGSDKLSVTFLMVDNNNHEQRVYYNSPMPPDLLKSEQVVVIGSYTNDLFIADKILLKCPSKYQEENIII